MTIDEAIEELKSENGYYANNGMTDVAEFNTKIIRLLEELKELRELKAGHLYAVAFNRGYLKAEKEVRNKVLDDFAKWLENKKYLMKEIQVHDFCYTHYDELKANCVTTEYFAEQLKAGEKNE